MNVKENHIKSTFKHAIIYGGAGIFSKLIGLIMLPLFAHNLQSEGYGVIGMVDTMLTFMTMFIGYGITGAMNRFYHDIEFRNTQNKVISTTIILMLVAVILLTTPFFIFNNFFSYLVFGKNDWGCFIVFASISFAFTMTSKTAENFILIQQKSLLLSSINIIRAIYSPFLYYTFIITYRQGVLGYLYASAIDSSIYSIGLHVYAIKKVGFSFDKTICNEIIKYSAPMIPGYLAAFARSNIDRILMRIFLGLSYVGIFEMLFKFVTLIGFLAVEPFSKIWKVKRFEICDLDDGPFLMAQVFTYHMVILLFIGLIFSLEIPIILKLLTPKEFWLDGWIIYLAVMSRIFHASYYHFIFGFLYKKNTIQLSYNQIISSLFSVVITVLLIWKFHLMGAVVASMISWAFQAFFAEFRASKIFSIPFDWYKITKSWLAMTFLYWIAKDLSVKSLVQFQNIEEKIIFMIEKCFNMINVNYNGLSIYNYIINNIVNFIDFILVLLYSSFFIILIILLNIVQKPKFNFIKFEK